MDRGSVLSGAAFRGAVYGVMAFLCVLLAGAVLTYLGVRQVLIRQLETQILETRALIIELHESSGRDGFLDAASDLVPIMAVAQSVMAIRTSDGMLLVGSHALPRLPPGWAMLRATEAIVPGELLVHTGRLGDLTLSLGRSTDALRRLERTLMLALGALGLAMTATLIAIGYTLSRRTQAKLSRLEAALDRVSRGDAGARAAVSARPDQVDRVADKINRHLDRLSQTMFAMRSTSAALAHDLRTPLTRAYLAADRIVDKLERGVDARDEALDIQAELATLAEIFDAILRISRIELVTDRTGFALIDLSTILREVAEAYGPTAEDAGQSLVLDPAPVETLVEGDARLIAQMTANLVQNALTHCPSGTRIALSAFPGPDGPCLSVSDNGPGIPESERNRIFDPFARLDRSRTTPGSGLGLSLVRAVATRHAARITLSDNAPGLRVEIVFPEPPAA